MNAPKKIEKRLCFKPPTERQKYLGTLAKPFVEPLTNLKEYREYNSIESIRKREAEKWEAKLGYNVLKTKRFDLEESRVERAEPSSRASLLPYDMDTKQDKLAVQMGSARGYLVTEKAPNEHVFGVCAESILRDEIASYDGETDIAKIINVLKTRPEITFFYLTHNLPKKHIDYHYYNLKVTSYQNINKRDYYTISTSGCTHFVGDEVELTSLERFEREYRLFLNIRKLPLFAQFRLWKVFLRWRKVVRYAQMVHCQRFLEANLFIANPTLRPALLNLREMCHSLSGATLCRIDRGRTSTLVEFLSLQMVQLGEVSLRLQEFHSLTKEIVRSACRTALLEYGFLPDDYLQDEADLPANLGKNMYDVDELIDACKLASKHHQLEPILYDVEHPLVGHAMAPIATALKQVRNNRTKLERRCQKIKIQAPAGKSSYLLQCAETDWFASSTGKMSYTQQARKRKKCRRLTCFVRLVDYLIMNTLHLLTKKSVYAINRLFEDEVATAPSPRDIDAMRIEARLVLHPEEESQPGGEIEAEDGEIEAVVVESAKTDQQKAPPAPQAENMNQANNQNITETIGPDSTIGPSENAIQPPFFLSELILQQNQINSIPTEDQFVEGLSNVVTRFQESMLLLTNLVVDTYFDAFSRPLINNKHEEKTCDVGPQLRMVFAEDGELQALIRGINQSLHKAFESVQRYIATFNEINEFYKDNDLVTVESLRAEREERVKDLTGFDKIQEDVEFFREKLATYKRQLRMTRQIPANRPLGLFSVDTSVFKNTVSPSPLRCLDCVYAILPEIARHEVDRLTKETQEGEYTLTLNLSTAVDYVNHLTFLRQIQLRIEPLEREADAVRSMYELIDTFKVPTPPEDLAVYQILFPSIERTITTIDRALAERDSLIDVFFGCLNKDVGELVNDIRDTKQAVGNPALLDNVQNRDELIQELDRLQKIVTEQQSRYQTYKGYAKSFKDLTLQISGNPLEDQILNRPGVRANNFLEWLGKLYPNVVKVEQPHYMELDELFTELRLKRLLWTCMSEWETICKAWDEVEFSNLDPEEVTTTTMKYLKSVTQLEKGLPPNSVVPILRQKVDEMRVILPTVGDLRNPSLQDRHWTLLENIIGFKMAELDAPLTLGKLKSLNAFENAAEIQEIAGMASSEASLESLLRKVENSWKSTEFIVVPYKTYKDVYVLGGTDEIQQLWDDSNINISTIASSKHVGPIKPQVDEWVQKLALFGETLDQWLACQKGWMYLESIFSAPDIQRQLPSEAKSFMALDKSFKEVMRKVQKVPLAMRAATAAGLLDTFRNNNVLLEQIQKCLEAYLESKRVIFPRFYFLSNDELLEILAQTRNPFAVQPHLRKCFDAIARLEFALNPEFDGKSDEPKFSNDILAMVSPEGESVPLTKGLKARGNVEEWLGKVEESMVASLRKSMKKALLDVDTTSRDDWLVAHTNQITLTVEQLIWARDVHEILDDLQKQPQERLEGLQAYEDRSFEALNNLAKLVRGSLAKLVRMMFCSLITIDVHARDIVTDLLASSVTTSTSFEWQRQLRYYWDDSIDNCVVHMSTSRYVYGYEYLGASPRLVITPLTDRCYLCLMGALQLDLGGAPSGPAGTGKTESTKDLAKSLAKQCVVFNCSDGLDHKMMGRFFSGLAQSGAWCCFDEFNRIDIEVLSVIAQQLITIKNAKSGKVSRFLFEGREIKLNPSCAAFITMNPGYAGRTELPDNLKALFRPISMMVPDYKLIAEVILYSEGFESSKMLAQKMTQMYKLCSEQLSKQDHYDFGMRALKSVLVMAGSLKRENTDKPENAVLIRALRDSNLPKFLAQDAVLFTAILQDLFPGVEVPEHDYGEFQKVVEDVTRGFGLQVVPSQTFKVIQFYETLVVRHGVMLVGPTGGGKTTVYRILAETLGTLSKMPEMAETNPDFQPVKVYVLNPKSITMGEIYGEVNEKTMEWHDGLMAYIVRQTCADPSSDHQWIICDGPVDALWIENMNTVLDDNKMLCLANSERIKLTSYVHMLFEVADLAVASPATVSRCGMVYVDPDELGWLPYTWLDSLKEKLRETVLQYILMLFEKFVEPALKAIMKIPTVIPQVPLARVKTMCTLMEVALTQENSPDLSTGEIQKQQPIIAMIFVFAMLWGLAGNVVGSRANEVDTLIRNVMDDCSEARMPPSHDLWSCFVDTKLRRFDIWERQVPKFKYNKNEPFFNCLVPTMDTVRYGFLLEQLLAARQSVLFTGDTGVGKTAITRSTLEGLQQGEKYMAVYINFSAQTSSSRTQEMIVEKMEKRRKGVIGAPKGRHVVIFVDDLNMPKVDTYGSQPPIELLRQLQDFGGFYNRDKLTWIAVEDVTLSAACGPPGGGRNPITARLVRHFSVLAIPSPSELTLKHIFTAIITGFMQDYPQGLRPLGDSIVGGAVEMYGRLAAELLPTPAKSHYVFNLRDLSKCVQGVLQTSPLAIRDKASLTRLFYHECSRVFHDRLVDETDRLFFNTILSEIANKFFSESLDPETFSKKPLFFGDFMTFGAAREDRLYEEITDMDKLKSVMQDYLDDYNMVYSKNSNMVFFLDAIQHICRIARMIRQDRGNALLVGVGGTGKRSLTKLAAHMNSYRCFSIELSRGYNYDSFHEDLQKLYTWTGVENKPTVFLFSDSQILLEEFVEDLNNILNSGEVPGLFDSEALEKLIIGTRPAAKEAGIAEGNREAIYRFCIDRVRKNLHLVLTMSPMGSAFRNRLRMFPSLVNCCTIDWFTEWPEEALLGVSQSSFATLDVDSGEIKDKVAELCTFTHLTVSSAAMRFFEELKRYYYTTPTSYLELLSIYRVMLDERRSNLKIMQEKFKNGLNKIQETNDLVARMEEELTALRPKLEQKQKDTEKLMLKLGEDQEKADVVRHKVKDDEADAKQKAMETQAIADDAQRDLDAAMPALEAANKALDALDKNDIAEIRVFTKPPQLVQTVMEAVCLMLGQKTDWATAKTLLGDSNLLRKLVEYPKDTISDSLLRKLQKYVDNPDFDPVVIEKVSKACKSLCMWVRALEMYARVYRNVEPKRKRLEEANKEMDVMVANLREKQSALKAIEDKIAELQATYDKSVGEKKVLEHNLALTAARLKRAAKLTAALSSEQERWRDSIGVYDVQLGNVVGDVFIAAACVAYYGAFTMEFRESLITTWVAKCHELEVPVSENVGLFSVLGDAFELRQWNAEGLPRDQVSTDNGIMVTHSRRWPLMIDPQEQANRWIRTMEAENGIRVVKPTDLTILRVLESCIRAGCPMLLEDVGESLDPALEPILLRQTFVKGGRLLIRLGDSDVEYDKKFKFYITTKLPNPHYLPEVSIKVTLINFTVTPQGLEDQLLSEVTRLERPELEEQRVELIIHINEDKITLQQIEDKILKLLFESEGNILDNEALINTLNESKATSMEIAKRLVEAEATEAMISAARSHFLPIAARGSVLYFVITLLADIDPMYQFSLKYFISLFNQTIEKCPREEESLDRAKTLINATTLATYNNVARGLFAQDKLVFSFMLCAKILLHEGTIVQSEWDYIVSTATQSDRSAPPQPGNTVSWLGARQWKAICDLVDGLPDTFNGLLEDVAEGRKIVLEIRGPKDASNESLTVTLTSPLGEDRSEGAGTNWDDRLSLFQKIILVRTMREEEFVAAVTEFVRIQLGRQFVETPSIDLPLVYADMDAATPLVFVLSTGSDPMAQLQRFARQMDYSERIHSVSLGQGQGPTAEKLLAKAAESGDWVFLQNCHLAASWMVRMEEIIKERSEATSTTDANYRLFLSSMPTKAFPITVLQNSVKVTNEPPKGIRANLRRALNDLSHEFFEENVLGADWRRVVYGMCLFHAVILERKKFGPLGWNIAYEFNDSDRECALLNLNLFSNEHGFAWDALTYITAEITYGGRVTDAWDQRCLSVILSRFFGEATLAEDYRFCVDSDLFRPPPMERLGEYLEYTDTLPLLDPTDIFNMHSNANLLFLQKETSKLLSTILDVQPRTSGGKEGRTSDEVVYDLAGSLLAALPNTIVMEKAHADLFNTDQRGRVNSLTTVLVQEVDRYNHLLKIIKTSLEHMQKAVKGFLVMSEKLEKIYSSFLLNTVPRLWENVAYPSLKPLSLWMKDLALRVEFINLWVLNGPPTSFWISGFFFPQGFLTGTLQNYARKYDFPIDHLSFDFTVLPQYRDQETYVLRQHEMTFGDEHPEDTSLEVPEDGVLIHGLFMDGFRWDSETMMIADSLPRVTMEAMPMVHMKPEMDFKPEPDRYIAPLYKTSTRAGVLSTTGISTNFITAIPLPSSQPQDRWISYGAALLCENENV
ncbi:Dynein heavy chain 6, axonemal [Echinococcus granulosus]|nr:Dynein heavy chain 6, axonemal [Echinococcus granulosus]